MKVLCNNQIIKLKQSRDCNGTRTNNHLVSKRTLNHLAKLTKMIELSCEYSPIRCIWLYVLIMSRTRFRVNPHSSERSFCLIQILGIIWQERKEREIYSFFSRLYSYWHWFHIGKILRKNVISNLIKSTQGAYILKINCTTPNNML